MGVPLTRILATFLLLFGPLAAFAQIPNPFIFPSQFDAGSVTADFNGDGKLDVIQNRGTVFLGNGDGTFTLGTPVNFGQNVPVGVVATADFNGDGKPDLVSISGTFVYIGLGNGDGTFQAPKPTNVGAGMQNVVVADVNGDGKPDIIGSNGPQFFVLLGSGGGTFAPVKTYSPFPNSVQQLTVADFNGDGKLDIAVAGYTDNANGPVGVMLGNGDGTFQTAITLTGVTNPAGIAAGDFNGDGKLDLAVSGTDFTNSEFTRKTYIFLGNGDGSLQPSSVTLPGNGAVSAVDLNGDGKLDLIVWGDPYVSMFLGKGNGTFGEPKTYLASVTSGSPVLSVADFNGDGKLDVTDGIEVLFGKGDGSFEDASALLVNVPGFDWPNAVVSGDFDGDDKTDLAIIFAALPNSLLYILPGDGAGNFSVGHNYPVQTETPVQFLLTADFNGDGKKDLFFVTNGTSSDFTEYFYYFNVMLGNGDGTFGAPLTGTLETDVQVADLKIADFNGDHIPDIAVVANGDTDVTLYLGMGDGTFGPPTFYFAGSQLYSFVTGEFNNDGHLGIVTCGSGGLGVLLGNGDGTFQPATFPNPPPPPPADPKYGPFPSLACSVLAAADFNGDGVDDLIIQRNYGAPVLLGNGNGTFTDLPQQVNGFAGIGAVADINGDGKLDLVSPDGLSVIFGNGDGTFGSTYSFLPPWVSTQVVSPPPPPPPVFALGDFNGDHLPDVAVAVSASTGGVLTLLNTLPPPAADFSMVASLPSPGAVAPASSASSSVTLTPVAGFSGDVVLSCGGLPSGTNCVFAPASLPGGSGKSTLTISTASSSPAGTYPIQIVGTSAALSHEVLLTFTVATSAGATTANLLPQALRFTQQISGTASPSQITMLTNTGSATLAISGMSMTGANAGDFAQTNNCGPSLVGYASCQITVTFTPTAAGSRTASLSINDNATGGLQVVSLSGTGQDFSLAPATVAGASSTVTAGQTASYTLLLAGASGFTGNVALACSGAPAETTCSISPATVSLSGTTAATAQVTVTTTAKSQVVLPGGNDVVRRINGAPALLGAYMLTLLVIASFYRSNRARQLSYASALVVFLLLALAITLASCGGGSSAVGSSAVGSVTGTTSGTYTITVTATAGSGATALTHTTNLSLIVQ
jgi:hypothetical protein